MQPNSPNRPNATDPSHHDRSATTPLPNSDDLSDDLDGQTTQMENGNNGENGDTADAKQAVFDAMHLDNLGDEPVDEPDVSYRANTIDKNDNTDDADNTNHVNNTDNGINISTNTCIPINAHDHHHDHDDNIESQDLPHDYSNDSFIYGDADSEEDTLEIMTIYDPDADRFEDVEEFSHQEVINCHVYSRKTGEQLHEVSIEEVSKILTHNNQFVWLGLYEPSLQTLKQMQESFDLHELALEDAVADHQRAKIESYGNDTLFVVVQTAKLEDNHIRYGKTAMFMGKNFIITIRTGPSNSYAPVREHYQRRPDKLRLGPIFVMHAILDFIVDNYLPVTDRMGRYLREQEHAIFSAEFSKSTLRSLYELKSQLVHMRAVILPVQDICNFFINHKRNELISFFPSSAKPYFRDVNDHLVQALDAVNGLNEMLSVAMDTYMAVVTMGQNDVVRKLAAWAAVLAVPTAIAGIYGMNFDNMPELHWQYSYFVILAVIISICVTLYYRFKKIGWL